MNKIISKVAISMVMMLMVVVLSSCGDDEITKEFAKTDKPNAEFTISAEKFRAGELIEFNDLSSDTDGFISAWNWDFGDGKASVTHNGGATGHIYDKEGEYTISLTVADNTGSLSEVYSKSISLEPSPASISPTSLWNFVLDGSLKFGSPAVSDDGTIFIGFTQADRSTPLPNFVAIKDGSKVWEQSITEGGGTKSDDVRNSPSISPSGSIFMPTHFSRSVRKLDAVTGDIIGEINLDTRPIWFSPVFATDGSVYTSGWSKSGVGFYNLDDALSGVNWVYKAGMAFQSTPAIGSDGTIYIESHSDHQFNAINPDGTEKWSVVTNATRSACAVAIGPDETIYYTGESGDEGLLIAFNPADGSEKWRSVIPAPIINGGASVAADGTIYVGANDNKLRAYNPVDGAEIWSYTAVGPIQSVPTIGDDDNIYFGDMAGYFHVIDSEGEKAFKTLQLGERIEMSVSIGSDGTIYVASEESNIGTVHAFKTAATGLQTGGWPMFAKDAKHTGR